ANTGSNAGTHMDTLVPKDHAASSQQLQQSTDINPAVDKGKEAAQPTDKYPQPRY
ncbi:7460_t:CDS:1, partial [Gigaspora rosea]